MQIDHPTTNVNMTDDDGTLTDADLSDEVEAIYCDKWDELQQGLTINYKSNGHTVTLFESEVTELYRFLDKQLNETND
jgi:hypothetical protein